MLQQNLPPNYSMSQHLELCKSNHCLHRQKSGHEIFLRHRPIFCKGFQLSCSPEGFLSGPNSTIGYLSGAPSSLQAANNAYVAQIGDKCGHFEGGRVPGNPPPTTIRQSMALGADRPLAFSRSVPAASPMSLNLKSLLAMKLYTNG